MSTTVSKVSSLNKIKEFDRIVTKYPGYIPIIIESKDKTILKQLKKNKIIISSDKMVSEMIYNIRKHLKLESSKAIFVFCNNKMISGSQLIGQLYEEYKSSRNFGVNDDKFLYVTLSMENTFGSNDKTLDSK